MPDLALTSCFATTFTYTSAGAGLDLKINATGLTLSTGSWRLLLGKGSTVQTSEPLGDFLQHLQAVLNTVGGGLVFTVSLSATTGLVTISANAPFTLTTIGADLSAVLGGIVAGGPASSFVAPSPPQTLCFIPSLSGSDDWNMTRPGAYVVDASGQDTGITSGISIERRTMALDFVVRDVATAAALPTAVTPAFPADSVAALRTNVGKVGAAGNTPWSWADQWIAAAAKVCALATDNFATLCAATNNGAIYHLVALPERLLTGPRWKRRRPTHPTWLQMPDFECVRLNSVPVSTRT